MPYLKTICLSDILCRGLSHYAKVFYALVKYFYDFVTYVYIYFYRPTNNVTGYM